MTPHELLDMLQPSKNAWRHMLVILQSIDRQVAQALANVLPSFIEAAAGIESNKIVLWPLLKWPSEGGNGKDLEIGVVVDPDLNVDLISLKERLRDEVRQFLAERSSNATFRVEVLRGQLPPPPSS